jgi:hypothetical protein
VYIFCVLADVCASSLLLLLLLLLLLATVQ